MEIQCSYCGAVALDAEPEDTGARVPVADVLCSCKAPGVVAEGVFVPFREAPPLGLMQTAIVDGKVRRVLVAADGSVELIDDSGARSRFPTAAATPAITGLEAAGSARGSVEPRR